MSFARRLLVGLAVAVVTFSLSITAASADTTTTSRPPNADEISTSLVDNGAALTAAAVVLGVGFASIGVLVLQRFLHAAVDAA